jgi:RNA polymerase sigma-70 factor (ECF subfamily)
MSRNAPVGSPEWFEARLDGARRHEPAAFTALYEWLAGTVAAYFRAHGSAEPDDLTSDVFLRAFQGLGRFSGDVDGFRSWVFTIAHHRLVDERRRRRRRPEPEPFAPSAPPVAAAARSDDDPAARALDALGTERVRRLLDRLPADQRDVVVLRILGDLSIAQVARAIGRSEGAVKQLQRRGLIAVRRILETEGVTP